MVHSCRSFCWKSIHQPLFRMLSSVKESILHIRENMNEPTQGKKKLHCRVLCCNSKRNSSILIAGSTQKMHFFWREVCKISKKTNQTVWLSVNSVVFLIGLGQKFSFSKSSRRDITIGVKIQNKSLQNTSPNFWYMVQKCSENWSRSWRPKEIVTV